MSIKALVKKALNRYPERLLREEFEAQKFGRFNERPVEFAFLFQHMARLYPRTILDIGVGEGALPVLMRNGGAIVTAADNLTREYWPNGLTNRHYHVVDDDIRESKLTGQFDLVTCISVLEHIKRWDDAVHHMARLVRTGGHLLITCPYNEHRYHRNVYDLLDSAYGKDAPYSTQSYSRVQLTAWCSRNDLEIVEQEYWRFWDGELWTQGAQIIPPLPSSAEGPHQLTCVLLRKR